MKQLIVFLGLLCIIFAFPLFPLYAKENNLDNLRIIIQFRPGFSLEERLNFHRDFELEKIKRIEELDAEIFKVKEGKLWQTLEKLKHVPRLSYFEPDYRAYAFKVSNDPYLSKQWGLQKIRVADTVISAWNYSQGEPAVKIAILDTGIDQNHEDLSSKIIVNKNCTDSSTIDDLNGHGTHVAGIAAAATNNGIGVAGVGYNVSLMNVKVLGDDGSGYYSWIAECIVWAADNGAKVINLSLGGGAKSKILENAVNYAWNKGVVLVAAAGNSGNSSLTYPAYYPNVIAVAATDANDQKASFSSFGQWVDVAAPGVSIFSTFPNHSYKIGKSFGYDYASGTSMATPHVAGLAALLWSTPYGISNSSVRARIENTAEKISGTGKYWQYGRINALKAVETATVLIEEPTSTPVPLFIPTKTPTPTVIPTLIPSPTAAFSPYPSPSPSPSPSSLPWWCERFPKWCTKFQKK